MVFFLYGTLLLRIKVLDMPKRIHTLLGFFYVNHDEDIYRHHRDRLGIYWKGRCKNMPPPPPPQKKKRSDVRLSLTRFV